MSSNGGFPSAPPARITINPGSWHWRLYVWWRTEFLDVGVPPQVDLCRYMRALLFWVPLSLTFYAAGIAGIAVVVGPLVFLARSLNRWRPTHRLGVWVASRPLWKRLPWERIGTILLIILVAVWAGTLIVAGLLDNWRVTLIVLGSIAGALLGTAGGVIGTSAYLEQRRPKEGLSFWGGVREYVRARKQKVCPLLKVHR